jgi:hypothetical protein
MVTQLLRFLDGGQERSFGAMLLSTLKVVSILFLLSFGLSAVITVLSPKSYVESTVSESQFVNVTE